MQCSLEPIISNKTKSKGLPAERAGKNARLVGVLGSQKTCFKMKSMQESLKFHKRPHF